MGTGRKSAVRLGPCLLFKGAWLTDWLRENASEVLNEYFESIGGRDKIFADTANALKTKKRGRPPSSTSQAGNKRSRRNGDHPADSEPPLSAKAATWKPPPGSWEDHIAQLDACEDEETGKLMVYLTWKNGHKTQHETSVIYQRCPQKVCSHGRTASDEKGSLRRRCCSSTNGMSGSSRETPRPIQQHPPESQWDSVTARRGFWLSLDSFDNFGVEVEREVLAAEISAFLLLLSFSSLYLRGSIFGVTATAMRFRRWGWHLPSRDWFAYSDNGR